MRGILRGASRLTMVAVAATGLGLSVTAASAGVAAAAGSKASAPALPFQPTGSGVTTGRNSVGDVYVLGPASTIKKFCPPGNELGFVCLFTGLDETGTGVAVYRGNNAPPGKCDDVPLAFVQNVFDDTNEVITFGDGTCANKIDVLGTDSPGVDENIYGGDLWIS